MLRIARNLVSSHKLVPSFDGGNFICAAGAALRGNVLGCVLYCEVQFRCADGNVMAGSMSLIAAVVHAVVLRFARHCLQITVDLLHTGYVWTVGIAQNPVFSCIKQFLDVPGVDGEPHVYGGRGSARKCPRTRPTL